MSDRNDPIVVIRDGRYDEIEAVLADDPIIKDMARGLAGVELAEITDANGHAVFHFMNAASKEYAKRGGTIAGHIGGPAAALIAILRAERGEQ